MKLIEENSALLPVFSFTAAAVSSVVTAAPNDVNSFEENCTWLPVLLLRPMLLLVLYIL